MSATYAAIKRLATERPSSHTTQNYNEARQQYDRVAAQENGSTSAESAGLRLLAYQALQRTKVEHLLAVARERYLFRYAREQES